MENSYFDNGSFLNQINDPNIANLQDFNNSYYASSPSLDLEYNNSVNNFPGLNYENPPREQQPIQQYQDYTNNVSNQTSYQHIGGQIYSSQSQCENSNMNCNTSKCSYAYNDGSTLNAYYSKPEHQQYQLNSNNNNSASDSLIQNVGFMNQSEAIHQQNQKSYISGNQFNQVPQTYSTAYYQSPGYSYTPHFTNPAQRNTLKRKKMDDTTQPDEDTKLKAVKKRKKKGANEPQKPVSAYALFFRDTQAVIKSENPNSTFGEISKLVASMWDSLSEESKQVYKQKTEAAKRDYLKQLASFRANLISQGGFEQDDEDQPLSVIQSKIKDTSSPSIPPLPRLQVAPSIQLKGITGAPTNSLSSANFYSSPPVFQNICIPPDTLYNYNDSQNSEQIQSLPSVNTWASTTAVPVSTPPPIQLRSMVPKAHSPVSFIASKPGQLIKVVPANQIADIQGKNKIIKMTDLIKPNTTSSGQIVVPIESISQNTTPQLSPVKSEENSDVQPILQTLAKESTLNFVEDISQLQITLEKATPPTVDTIDLTESPPILNKIEAKVEADILPNKNSEPRRPNVRVCVHANCDQIAISDPQWNDEYCSNDCVVAHCRDVFDAWTSMRQITAKSE